MTRNAAIDLSIVVVHRNGAQMLVDCLASLASACDGLAWEAILVDNGSSDDSLSRVRGEFPNVQVIENTANLGFTKANNQGLANARGRHMVLLNNDTVCQAKCFTEAVNFMDQHPESGVVGLRLLNADGSRQMSCRRFPTFSQALFNRYSLLTRIFPSNRFSADYLMSDFDGDKVQDVDWVSGACLIIRGDVFEKIGGLDERFFMYSEDVDYCYRVWQAGWRVTFIPLSSVYHLIGQTSSRHRFMPIFERHRSMYRFYKKHYSRDLMLLDLLTAIIVMLRCVTHLVGALLKPARPAPRTLSASGGQPR